MAELLDGAVELAQVHGERDEHADGQGAIRDAGGAHADDHRGHDLRDELHAGEVEADQAHGAHAQSAVGVAHASEAGFKVVLREVGLGDADAADELGELAVDRGDLRAGFGVVALGVAPKYGGCHHNDRHGGEGDQGELAVGGHQHDGDAGERADRDDRLGQTGLQEAGQRVDVRGHARHDRAGQARLEKAQAQLLQVRVGAQAQAVQEALAGARGQHGHRGRRRPRDNHHGERDQPGADQAGLVGACDAAVHRRAHQGGEGEVRQYPDHQQRDRAGDEPAHRAEEVAHVERARRGAQLVQPLLREPRLLGGGGKRLHTREQRGRGVDCGRPARGGHDHPLLLRRGDLGPQIRLRGGLRKRCGGIGGHRRAVLRARGDLVTRAELDDGSAPHHRHRIRVIHGGLPVRHGEHRDVCECLAQVGQDGRLGDGVDGACRVVQHKHVRLRHERAGKGDALALAARQGEAAFAHFGVVAVRQALDEFVRARQACGLAHSAVELLGREGRAHGDVVAHRGGEQKRVVEDAQDVLAKGGAAVEKRHAPRVRLVEAAGELDGHGLARAGRADERDRFARADGKAEAVEDVVAARGEVDVVEAQADGGARVGGSGRGGGVGCELQHIVEAVERAHAHLQPHVLVGQHGHGRRHRGQVRRERDELADGDLPPDSQRATGDDGDHQRHLGQLREHRLETRGELRGAHLHRVEVAAQLIQTVDFPLLLAERFDHAHAGDRLLHVLRQLRGGVLVDPRGSVERLARAVGLPEDQRQQRERHQGQWYVHAQHHSQGDGELHHAREQHGQVGQHHVVLVQVRDGPGDDLAGDDVVLAGSV